MTNDKGKHTKEPWHGVGCGEYEWPKIVSGDNLIIADVLHNSWGHGVAVANLARIVACVNGCEGINPEAVKEMLEALEAWNESFKNTCGIQKYEYLRPLELNACYIDARAAIAHATGTSEKSKEAKE